MGKLGPGLQNGPELRFKSRCCRTLRVKAVGLCTQTESIPACLHFALWCEEWRPGGKYADYGWPTGVMTK